MNHSEAMNNLSALFTMKPLQLMETKVDHLTAIGNALSWEEITKAFKKYKPLERGNKKLSKDILSFSLLPVVTCSQRCLGCYDVRSLRWKDVRIKRIVNTVLATSGKHRERLFETIVGQAMRSKTAKAIRIHVGGDFFSADYVNRWVACARYLIKSQDYKVYTYTKTEHTKALQSAGVNVVKSRLDDGRFNFGSLEEVRGMAKEFHGVVCPTTVHSVPDHFCGAKCKACQDKTAVFFVKH